MSSEEILMEYAKHCMSVHKRNIETWEHGNIKKVWIDQDDNICVEYESCRWWHYRIIDNTIEWW